jgi:hypothetical protein
MRYQDKINPGCGLEADNRTVLRTILEYQMFSVCLFGVLLSFSDVVIE